MKRHDRGQAGMTILEALLSLIIVSVAIISIAGGLITSLRIDNATNESQRMNLALQTFIENVEYVPPGGDACGLGGLQPPVSSPGVMNPSSHASSLMEVALASDEVQKWVDRQMLFRITDVDYASDATGPGAEVFGAECSAAASGDAPRYPVARLGVEVCRLADSAALDCGESRLERSVAVVRGGRR